MTETICERNVNVVPGWKYYVGIVLRIQEWKTDGEQIDQHDEIEAEMTSFEEDTNKSITRNNLHESFASVGISPLEFNQIPSHSKIPATKKKMERVFDSPKEKLKLTNMTSIISLEIDWCFFSFSRKQKIFF